MPLPGSQGADPSRRPRIGDAGVQRVHRPAYVQARRRLTDERPDGPSEASARRSVSRVLSHGPCGAAGMAIHLGRRSPDDSCGLPEGWAAPLSPTHGRPRAGCALLFDLAPGRVCRVSLRSTACAVGRHRHCGTGPRLTAGGRYPPPCAAELGLSSRRTTSRPIDDAQPSDRLADRRSLPRGRRDAQSRCPSRRPAGVRPRT